MSGGIATPRNIVSRGIYTGEDLRRSSPRQGAYDAYAIPSLIGGRLVTRDQQREELLAPLPPAPPMPAARGASRVAEPEPAPLGEPPAPPPPAPEPLQPPPVVTYVNRVAERTVAPAAKPYSARGGSFPDLVLTHLREYGGHLFFSEVATRYGVQPTSITSIFKPAVSRGALIRVRVGKRMAFALPGYVPPSPTDGRKIAIGPVDRAQTGTPLDAVAAELPVASMAQLKRVLESTARLLLQAAELIQLGHPTDLPTNLAGEKHAHD